ncbi:MAG: hydrogenase maturation protease [Bacteroidales bacterium]|nr:MAG: hydrogenase maturation protease [Bacteroidales bacterium]
MNQRNYKTGIADIPGKNILILGCGNILFGDDGFGPLVTEELLKNYNLPENVGVINAGTSVRNILFDIALFEKKPGKIIIVDAVDAGKKPGEIFELSIDEIPEKKIDDFSMHQLPTSNLLKELKDLCKVNVTIIACQIENIPEEVTTSISKIITDAIPEVCKRINEIISA